MRALGRTLSSSSTANTIQLLGCSCECPRDHGATARTPGRASEQLRPWVRTHPQVERLCLAAKRLCNGGHGAHIRQEPSKLFDQAVRLPLGVQHVRAVLHALQQLSHLRGRLLSATGSQVAWCGGAREQLSTHRHALLVRQRKHLPALSSGHRVCAAVGRCGHCHLHSST